jgi:hypothetical protein
MTTQGPNIADEPNDSLIVQLFHITGLQPTYFTTAGKPVRMLLLSVIVFIDNDRLLDMNTEQIGAVIEWAARKCQISVTQVQIQEMPGAEARVRDAS